VKSESDESSGEVGHQTESRQACFIFVHDDILGKNRVSFFCEKWILLMDLDEKMQKASKREFENVRRITRSKSKST
jgi:hypothetical protein